MSFSFATAGRIEFGANKHAQLLELMRGRLSERTMDAPVLVVTGSCRHRAEFVLEALTVAGREFDVAHASGEPTVSDVERTVRLGRALKAQSVIACGGGSALDLGKATAALLANPGRVLDYLEVVGRGQPLSAAALPCVALPTTSGTGAEVTKNAVVSSPEHGIKVSLRDDSMLPTLALVDPVLTLSLSPDVSAATGLDALTQCIEPFLSIEANPLTDALAREGIERAARSLRRVVDDGSDLEARTDMSLCSLLGGLSLANAKLGAVHGFAGVLGGMVSCPHGAVCARLLVPTLVCNLRALQARAPQHPALPRFDELARRLTGDASAEALLGLEWLGSLVEELRIPRLADMGLVASKSCEVVALAARSSSMKGNPICLEEDELNWIVEQAF